MTLLQLILSALFATLRMSIASADQPVSLACPPGHYVDASGQMCVWCPAGTVQPTDGGGANGCTPCPTGRVAAGRATRCAAGCAPGRYRARPWRDDQASVGAGKSPSSHEYCRVCPAGKYQRWEERPSCRSCPEGQYTWRAAAQGRGARRCELCSEAAPCTSGRYRVQCGGASAGACVCAKGRFTVTVPGTHAPQDSRLWCDCHS